MAVFLNQIDGALSVVDKLEARLGGLLEESLRADLINAGDILREVRVLVNGVQECCMLMAPLSLGGQAMPREEAKKLAGQYAERFERFVGVHNLF